MTEFQTRLEANIRESLRFAVGEVDEEAVAHMVAGVNAVLDHPSAPPQEHLVGWEPIETAPKDGRHVLLYCDYYGISRCTWESWRGVWRSDDPNHGIGFPQPTHWMPLPDYPAGSVRAENARRAAIAANPEDQP